MAHRLNGDEQNPEVLSKFLEEFEKTFGEPYLELKEWSYDVAAQIAAGVKLKDLKYSEQLLKIKENS